MGWPVESGDEYVPIRREVAVSRLVGYAGSASHILDQADGDAVPVRREWLEELVELAEGAEAACGLGDSNKKETKR